MPYKRHQPVSVEKMMNEKYAGHHTICETLREIFLITEDEEIKLKCRLATSMAKSMHRKLKAYKKESESRQE